MSKDEPDIFSCSICLEHYKKPKLLPCQHTFCESCLDTYIQFSTGNDTLSSKWFLCPLCRQNVKSPDINSKPREWASLMPVNSMIISLMQTSEAGATYNEANESRNCGPCKRDEEISTGSYWCPNCLEFLCENCKKFHRRIKISEMHKIIPVEEMDKEHAKVTEFDEPCPDHVGEILKVFCIGHKAMCCVMCLATHHNECKEIKTLEEMAHQMEGDKSGTIFINSLDEIKTRLGETIKDREKHIAHLNGRCEFVLSQMEEIVHQAKSNLDAFLEDFESKLTSLNEAQNEIIFETKQKVECLLKTLEYGEQILRFLSRNGHSKQLFIAIEKSKVQILDHLKHLKMNSIDDQMVDYYLSVDEILLKLKTPTSEMKLAQVEPKFETSNKQMLPVITELSVICDQQMHIQRLLSKADVSEFEAVKLWDVKGKGKISSGVFLSSGSLVCCDCINKYLLAYDENGSFICKFKLDYFPLNLDVFENEILVSAHQKNHIYTYTFKNNNFKELQKIEIPYQCKGIVVVENKIAITNGYNIDVITILGGILQSITVEDFSLASFCHIASDNSNIYYSHDDSLVEMSLNLKDVKKHKLLSFLVTKHMRGIAVDQNGNKFICDSKSDSICVVSKNCRRCRFLETNIKPFAVQCEKNGSRFFVANSKTDGVSDILLEVYDIHLKKK